VWLGLLGDDGDLLQFFTVPPGEGTLVIVEPPPALSGSLQSLALTSAGYGWATALDADGSWSVWQLVAGAWTELADPPFNLASNIRPSPPVPTGPSGCSIAPASPGSSSPGRGSGR
jgi:hypothetical protein